MAEHTPESAVATPDVVNPHPGLTWSLAEPPGMALSTYLGTDGVRVIEIDVPSGADDPDADADVRVYLNDGLLYGGEVGPQCADPRHGHPVPWRDQGALDAAPSPARERPEPPWALDHGGRLRMAAVTVLDLDLTDIANVLARWAAGIGEWDTLDAPTDAADAWATVVAAVQAYGDDELANRWWRNFPADLAAARVAAYGWADHYFGPRFDDAARAQLRQDLTAMGLSFVPWSPPADQDEPREAP